MNELLASGAEISDAELINQLILSMGSHFENVIESLQEKDEDELTLEYVKKHFTSAQVQKNPMHSVPPINDGKSEVTAFHTFAN